MDQSLDNRISATEYVVSGFHILSPYSMEHVMILNQLAIMKSLKRQEEEWEDFKEERFLAQSK